MIRVSQSHLSVVARSHPGMTGKNNEDRYAVSAYRLEKAGKAPALFAILADGIGGHRAGEIAADMAVELVSKHVAASDGKKPLETLEEAIGEASRQIYAQAAADPEQHGMGATCACVWVIHNRLYTAAIGDSRIYLIRNKRIRQVSTDHTWVQEALDRGVIKPEEAPSHPNAHVIRRYLGSPEPPAVDFRLRLEDGEDDAQSAANQGLLLHEGDRLLLCSDGLTDLVQDVEILKVFQKNKLDNVPQALIALANQRGGHDNITVVAIKAPRGAFRRTPGFVRALGWALAVLLLAAAIALGWFIGPDLWAGVTGQVAGTQTPTLSFVLTEPVVEASPTLPLAQTPEPTLAANTPAGTLTSVTPAAPQATGAATLLPAGGPTLTPWPTNTLKP